MLDRTKHLFLFEEDSASEQEVIEGIEKGVNFRGAKLWILIIAVFVASLGLNTNSAAVIIGAMLISPLMGPIIGMGLGVGIYDFDLLRRSWRNYIVATIFSILTATVYFLISPISVAQSELLARTSPTFYDVLIALSGGLAGIIALSSKSQRTGNVIPGVAIATALMPPLCTVGFGIATANWAYAAGALYLFLINTIFIAFSTLIGAMFIMKFSKKAYMDHAKEVRVKRAIYAIAFVTIIPAILLTIGMVRQTYFEQRVNSFIQHELHFPMTQVIKQHADYDSKSFDVVLIGNEVDSATLTIAQERLPFYKLDGVAMNVFQGSQSADNEAFREILDNDTQELHHAETIIAQQKKHVTELEQQLQAYTGLSELAPQILYELSVLFPQVTSVALAQGTLAQGDKQEAQVIAIISANAPLPAADQERLTQWLQQRLGRDQIRIIVEVSTAKENAPKKKK